MTFDLKGSIARGGKRAEEMQEENKLPSGGFETVNWFSLADRESKFYRLLDDHNEWFTVMQHSFVPTRPVPSGWTAEQAKRQPPKMSAVCRKTPEFVQFFPDGCYICDGMHKVRPNEKAKNGKYYAQVRLWARGVEREEVRVTAENQAQYPDTVTPQNQHMYPGHEVGSQVLRPEGTILGYRDVEVEVDELDDEKNPTGKKIMKKKIVVFNMAIKNFFGPLQGLADVYGTVLDRDFRITRKGKDQNTDYDIVPLNPVPRADGSILDMRTSQVIVDGKPTGELLREQYFADGPDLLKLIEDRLVDEYYHRFFDDRVPFPERDSDKPKDDDSTSSSSTSSNGSSSAPAQSAPSAPAGGQAAPSSGTQTDAAARLAAMRSRVKGDNPPPQSSQDAGAAPEESAEPAAAAAGGPVSFN